MPIADLCQKNVVTVPTDASVKSAAQLMKYHHVGTVVIVDADQKEKPVGILTDRDIALSIVANSLSYDIRVGDVMSTDLLTADESMGLTEAVELMEKRGVRRLVLVDAEQKLRGLIALDDLMQLLARELSSLGKVVERQINFEKTYRPDQSHMLL